MDSKKIYFINDVEKYLKGYTNKRFDDENGKLLDGYIGVENPSQDLLENFIRYKIIDGEITKMDEEEFKNIYPNYGAEPEQAPTEQDKINAMLLAKIAMLEAKEITKNV